MIFRVTAIALLFFGFGAQAAEAPSLFSAQLSEAIKLSLSERIPDAEIRLPSLEKICSQAPLNIYQTIKKARILEDRPNGIALIEVSGTDAGGKEKSDLIQTPYSAWRRALVPIRRVYPNTKLRNEDFKTIEVNVASGAPREYRGVIVSPETDLSGKQSRQSVLEGQLLIQSAIERQPDLRRGDLVRLDLTSGDLILSTQATVSEGGAIGDRVKVLTTKSKKEVVGTIKEDHSVEVKL